jgi:hypothetical protein
MFEVKLEKGSEDFSSLGEEFSWLGVPRRIGDLCQSEAQNLFHLRPSLQYRVSC